MLLLLVGAASCGQQDSEAVDLLEDSKVGLAHLNDELHPLKDPAVGLAHLNDEAHIVRQLATDPKLGFEHLNSEVHTIKEMLASLSTQVESMERRLQSLQK